MPGHSVAESQLLEVQTEVNKLEDLIQKHDIVFLLTDTRESRWLPSLLAKLHGKVHQPLSCVIQELR
jgi:ubiquitin-like modifier-activating enzyme ATG7